MARWADDLTPEHEAALRALLARLVRDKPRGWSVVLGDRELVLRPEDRNQGRASATVITTGLEPMFQMSFFAPAVNQWVAFEKFPFSEESSPEILDWVQDCIDLP